MVYSDNFYKRKENGRGKDKTIPISSHHSINVYIRGMEVKFQGFTTFDNMMDVQ
jgi:hypothetical protein